MTPGGAIVHFVCFNLGQVKVPPLRCWAWSSGAGMCAASEGRTVHGRRTKEPTFSYMRLGSSGLPC